MLNAQYAPALSLLLVISASAVAPTLAADCPQWGGSPCRNAVSTAKGLPTDWEVGDFERKTEEWIPDDAENIRWVAKLGSTTYGTPIIAGGKIYCATNNGAGYVKRYGADVDLGCLLCFNLADGKFLWQLSREKLKAGRAVDWPMQGICCAPMIEGDRGWVVTNRGEVVCFDTAGFHDDENDGPYKSEPPVGDKAEADIVWIYDMMGELGVEQHNMASCSVTGAGNLLLVNTSNGVDESHEKIPAPKAPSFIAIDKTTGKLIWADGSPGENILHGQWGSAASATLGDVPQAIFSGGDGWLYSFRAEPTTDGKPELLWKFDCNPKATVWKGGGMGDRNSIIATPVIYDGHVFLATGQDPEHGEGQGRLWRIDPTKRGDVSAEIVLDKNGKPVPPRRVCAVDAEAGEVVKPNPNSAAVWCYEKHDFNDDKEYDFEEIMHRTMGMCAIKDDILMIADLSGLIHCVDAKTGKPHWTHDTLAAIWGSPLIADGKVYIGDEDGDVSIFELSAKKNLIAETSVATSVYSGAVAVDGVLYISTRSHLIAIEAKKK